MDIKTLLEKIAKGEVSVDEATAELETNFNAEKQEAINQTVGKVKSELKQKSSQNEEQVKDTLSQSANEEIKKVQEMYEKRLASLEEEINKSKSEQIRSKMIDDISKEIKLNDGMIKYINSVFTDDSTVESISEDLKNTFNLQKTNKPSLKAIGAIDDEQTLTNEEEFIKAFQN